MNARYQVAQCHLDTPGDSWELVDWYTGEQLAFGLFRDGPGSYQEALKECAARNSADCRAKKLRAYFFATPKTHTASMTYDEIAEAAGVQV